jgi:hypothetical protein
MLIYILATMCYVLITARPRDPTVLATHPKLRSKPARPRALLSKPLLYLDQDPCMQTLTSVWFSFIYIVVVIKMAEP